MKQALHLTGFAINGRQVSALMLVAERTTQRQVFRNGVAPVLHGNDMVDFVANECQAFERQAISGISVAFGSELQARLCLRHPHQVLQELIAFPVIFFLSAQCACAAFFKQFLDLTTQPLGGSEL